MRLYALIVQDGVISEEKIDVGLMKVTQIYQNFDSVKIRRSMVNYDYDKIVGRNLEKIYLEGI
jgi:hypothetical protein